MPLLLTSTVVEALAPTSVMVTAPETMPTVPAGRGSPNQFMLIRGSSHLFLLLSGYAVFDNPTMPIVGPGETAIVRYVTLPNEAHGYAARETLLHVLAERINWFDKYVKNAGPKTSTAASR